MDVDDPLMDTGLHPLLPGETVWLPEQGTNGTVLQETAPRSYTVQTSNGQYCRNRRHINPLPTGSTTSQLSSTTRENSPTNSSENPLGVSIQSPSPPSTSEELMGTITRNG